MILLDQLKNYLVFCEENDWGSGGNIRFGIKVVANNRSLEGFNFHNLTINNIYPSPGSPNNTPVAGFH